MMQLDPMKVIQMIRSGANPQQIMMKFLEDELQNTPLGVNLLDLAKNNRSAEIEQIARNIYQQRGLDYDTEFNAFKQTLGLK